MSPVQRPNRSQVLVFEAVDELRAWFDANHATAPEAFIGYYRKGVSKPSVTYAQAVEEALCFGWIDGIGYGIDDELRTNRFTPRRRTSSWSAINIAKVAELRAAGRMHPAGIRAFEERDRRRDQIYSYERPPQQLPDAWLARLRADVDAWTYWERQPPSYRNGATHWVMSAVKPETRERRFSQMLDASRAGTRRRPFLVSAAERAP